MVSVKEKTHGQTGLVDCMVLKYQFSRWLAHRSKTGGLHSLAGSVGV